MPTAAQMKKDLTPRILVGKSSLGKLDVKDLEQLTELVNANKLSSLVLDIESKRLVKLKAKVNVAEVTGTASVKALAKLKSLYLQWGSAGVVTKFEDGFFDSLESVEMQAGVIEKEIPRGLLAHRDLRALVIHNTAVKLPTSVDWPKLETLRIGSAGPTLPECLLLRSLTSLAISADDSKLTSIPDAIGDLEQLESLDLSRNALTELPAAMKKLRALKHLGLTQNKLKTLPEWLADLPALETLSVDGELPAALQRFAR